MPSLRQNSACYPDHNGDPGWALVQFLEREFEEQSKKFDALRAEGLVTFESLRYLFARNSKFWGKVDNVHKVRCGALFPFFFFHYCCLFLVFFF